MYLCSADHEEICYESREYPLCEAKEEIADLGSEIEKLENRIDDLESEIRGLNNTISELQSEVNLLAPPE